MNKTIMNKRSCKLAILSGPPGSGKTTIARLVADSAEQPTVHLVTDGFYLAIRKGFLPPYLPEAAKQNKVVIGVLVSAMLGYAGGGYDVIIDGIIGPWSLQPFIDAARTADFPLSFTVLRPSLQQTLARAVARTGNELKTPGPIKGLYGAFEKLDKLERYAIDSTNQSIEETVDLFRRNLATGQFLIS